MMLLMLLLMLQLLHEEAGEPLCVALGDERTLAGRHREHTSLLQGQELGGGTGGKVDLQG